MSEYKKWEPDEEKYGQSRAAHFSNDDISTSRIIRSKEAKKRKKKQAGLRIAGALTLFLALAVGTSFAGAALVKAVAPSVDTLLNQSAESTSSEVITSSSDRVISNVQMTSGDSTSDSKVLLNDVSDVVSAVMPAVVSITSRSYMSDIYGQFRMANSPYSSDEEVDSGVGSGTIVGYNSEELLILTSYHVVEGCSSLYVTFCDDNSVDGYIKDVSSDDDIAVVAVRLDDLSEDTLNSIAIATISNEENEIGEGVIVIGDALGYGQSVVTGIISALDREITVEGKQITVIQTDAAINSGNSGGCTLNSKGEIIGISEAKISSDAVEGMCYAISVRNYYDKIMEMLDEAPLGESEIARGGAA